MYPVGLLRIAYLLTLEGHGFDPELLLQQAGNFARLRMASGGLLAINELVTGHDLEAAAA